MTRKQRWPLPIQRWAVGRHGEVRERESGKSIGRLLGLRARGGMGKQSGYLATRPNGQEREFKLQFDACYWLMQAYDSAEDASNG